jgi:hypothetical protein
LHSRSGPRWRRRSPGSTPRPALSAVAVALSIILEDLSVLAVGIAIGTGGIALILTIGTALVHSYAA